MSEKPHSQNSAGPLFENVPGQALIHRLVAGHFDTPPQNSITAEQVRLNHELSDDACATGHCSCEPKRLRWVLEQLRKHSGVSSSACAVIDAALE